MKHALKLMTVLLVGVAACVADSGNQPTDNAELSTSSTELSVASSESARSTGPVAQDVTCNFVWECDEICGFYINNDLVRYSTNVLHEECSDGSDTVQRVDPCGEDCF
jgi:hypothetical protein